MKISRTTESGVKITYERTIDKPSTRVIEIVNKLKRKSGKKTKKKKTKSKKSKILSKKILGKPKVKIVKKLDPVKTIMKGRDKPKLVREGEEGWFKKEMLKEKQNFLGGYSL